jgi:glyoxylase-like metal-dependent hydrolase (beta-lactamase superfamily II)
VTHCHADHSPLAAWLGETTGAPTLAFGPHGAIDTETELDDEPEPAEESEQESEQESAGEGATPEPKETTDVDFDPDVRLADGTVAAVGHGYTLRAVHTPGHTSNHVCFALEEESALFTGDHIMGWSTTVVSPPDGDMRAYIGSVRKLQGRSDAVLWPTHGAPVTDAAPFLAAYLQHRLHREQQVLDVVRSGIERIPDMVEILYADVRKELHKAAGRSVLAHLVKLVEEGQVAASGVRSASGSPRLVSNFHPDSGC